MNFFYLYFFVTTSIINAISFVNIFLAKDQTYTKFNHILY